MAVVDHKERKCEKLMCSVLQAYCVQHCFSRLCNFCAGLRFRNAFERKAIGFFKLLLNLFKKERAVTKLSCITQLIFQH